MADDIWTIPELVRYRAENMADVKAFTFYDSDGLVSYLTFRDIYTLAGRFSKCLKDWGFKPGDIIANGVPNSPERVITDFGIMMAGCVKSNCQVIEKDGSDFWNSARISECQAVIVCPRQYDPVYRLFSPFLSSINQCHGIHDIKTPQAPSIHKVILCDRCECEDGAGREEDQHIPTRSFLDNLRNSDKSVYEAVCAPSSLATLFGTSGTTGFSKIISMTHEELLRSGRMFKAAESSVYYINGPMGWVAGFPYDVLCHGTRRVGQDKLLNKHSDSPGTIWDIISKSKCTGAALVPGLLYKMVDLYQDNPPEHKVQFITSTGEAMKKQIVDAIGLLCHAVVVSYGSTEGGMFSFEAVTSPSDFKDFYAGKIMADVQIKIVDLDGNEVENGQEGEIFIKSKRLVKKYYNNSGGKPEDVFTADGWYRSHDRGYVLSDGRLFCLGRQGDVVSINSGLIYLSWPENILNKCPDIMNSSVVVVNDCQDEINDNSKLLVACVVPKKGRSDLTEQEVADYFNRSLMSVEKGFTLKLSRVFVLDNLPLLPNGKVNKRFLKQIVVERMKNAK